MHNANIGVLGHVDSGKTSLAKALSTQASTAAFDHNPQSQERGITLDLGFSACIVPPEELPPAQFGDVEKDYPKGLQLTFVDCPGHASLIRTIMGGAQIIDVMMLVIDVTKGIQTQTAECIVVGEMLSRRLLVVLNKVDMLPGETQEEKDKNLEKMKKKLRGVFTQQTRWPTAQFVTVAAAPQNGNPVGMAELTKAIVSLVVPSSLKTARQESKPANFLLSVDHCFAIKGQGTVMTGTIIDGKVSVGDEVELPDYQLKRKVKGIQVFRKPVNTAYKGDRIGLCVPQFDAKEMERGICCGVGAGVVSVSSAILSVKKVRFHKLSVEQGSKYHMTVGHTTVMGTMRFFSRKRAGTEATATVPTSFDPTLEYDYQDELPDSSASNFLPPPEGSVPGEPSQPAAPDVDYYAVVQLEQPVTCQVGATIIASKLDTDIHVHQCRLAVQGTLLCTLASLEPVLKAMPGGASIGTTVGAVGAPSDLWRHLNVFKRKMKVLAIDRLTDANNCICRSFVKEGPEAQKFLGLKVVLVPPSVSVDPSLPPDDATVAALEQGAVGVIESTFGKSGKVKVRFNDAVFPPEAVEAAKKKKKEKKEKKEEKKEKKEGKSSKKKDKEEKKDKEASTAAAPAATDVDAEGDEGEGDASAGLAALGTIVLRLKKFPYAVHGRLAQ